MVKEPHPGRVKTRLGRDIGLVQSAWWFRHQSTALIRRLARDPRWQTVLSVSPDTEGLQSRVWPKNLARLPQGRGDLGTRMARAFQALTPGPVVLIGADIPGVQSKHIARAFQALGRHDLVFGPAQDGGFWLVGMTQVPKGVFQNVRWSTDQTLSDTLAGLTGHRIALIDTLNDVDTAADL